MRPHAAPFGLICVNRLVTLSAAAASFNDRVTLTRKKWSERQDLNLRRLGPKPSALARLSYAPTLGAQYPLFCPWPQRLFSRGSMERMGWPTGLEPATSRTTIWGSTIEL